ncbi:MAG: Ig-like domain-containing protein [Clostridia bacterium]|nr:Ig-like domain-containing protein [Clostridia bacterium]
MRKSSKLLAILLAILMVVSVFPVSVFAADNIISAVDTSELVMTTKFLYSGTDESGNVWASNAAALVNVTAPTFYTTIPATVDGVETDLPVTWVSENYQSTVAGTYTFTAVAEGYTWECPVPTITVEVVEGALGLDGIRGGIITNHTAPINVVYKDYGVYDATGCNQMFTLGDATRLVFGAALSSVSVGATRTDAFTAPEYDTNIYASGNIVGSVAGGGYGVNLKGDTNVVVENATLSGSSTGQVFGGGFSNKSGKHAKVDGNTNVTVIGSTLTAGDAAIYGGGWAYNSSIDTTVTGNTNITVIDSTVSKVYGGSYAYKTSVAPVNGTANITIVDSTVTTVNAGSRGSSTASKAVVANANIDISGDSTVTTINAGGTNYTTTSVSGTTTVNIHNIADPADIGTISKGNAAKLVVKLDDTSKSLLTDGSITLADVDEIYVNNELYVDTIAVETLTDIPDAIVRGSASTLPTTFGELAGFVWSGDDTTAGDNVFTLTAPEGYFFDGYVKTKEYTITVTDGTVAVTGVTLNTDAVAGVKVNEEFTLTATVAPDEATDKTVTWTVEGTSVVLSDVEGDEITVKAVAEGQATITATAGEQTATCVVDVEAPYVITAVETDGLVWETKFPYNYEGENITEYWSKRESYVENPTFYPTLKVTVDGTETDLPVTWVSTTEYDGRAIGATYTFKPEAVDYVWECPAPTVTVTIVDAGWTSRSSYQGFLTGDESIVEYVVRGTGSSSSPNQIYDATGCNLILNGSIGSGLDAYGGKQNGMNTTTDVQPTKTGATVPSTEDTKLVIYDTTIKRMYAAGKKTHHNADTYAYIINATATGNIYAGGSDNGNMVGNGHIYIIDSTVSGTMHGGGAGATVTGNAYLDVTGDSHVAAIQGGGTGATSGTTYVNIHDLAETATVGTITIGNTTKLVVNLDDTSAELIANVTNWTTDENIEVYINGVRQIPAVESVTLDATELELAVGSEAVQLTATVAPANADQTVVWTVEGDAVTVVDGLVTAVKAGTATVTATAGDSSATCTVTVTSSLTPITAVNTDGLVLETTFLYSGNLTDFEGGYRKTVNVTEPTFYPTIPVQVEGEWIDLEVEWVCTTEYDSTAVGTYYFVPELPPIYECADGVEVPTIKVNVVEGVIVYRYASNGASIMVKDEEPIDYVLNGVQLYDATGYNLFGSVQHSTAQHFAAGPMAYSYYEGENETPGLDANGDKIEGYSTKLTVTGERAAITAGGGHQTTIYGDTNLVIDGLTTTVATYAGGMARNASGVARVEGDTHVTVKNSTLTTLYGGGVAANNASQDVTVTGNAYIDVSGAVTITTIYGGGNAAKSTSTADLIGVAYVNIHDLAEGSTIGAITRDGTNYGGSASKLVVNLDDSSAELLDVVTDWKTDANIEVYINGVRQIPAVESVTLDVTELAFTEGDDAVQLTATVEPANADQTVVWTVEGDAVTVVDGLVTPVKAGNATVTATAGDLSATCTVTVAAKIVYADYSIVTNAEALKPTDFTSYTNASVQAYNEAIAALTVPSEGLTKDQESVYTDYATAVETAVGLLKVKANYTSVNAQVEAAGQVDRSLYTATSLAKLDEALENVNYDLDADQQATVNGYATAIELAIAGLEMKPADYSAVETAKGKVEALDRALYTADSLAAVDAAVAAVVDGLDITKQAEVDAMADAIEDALGALAIKAADYSAVETAKGKVEALDRALYTADSLAAVDAAVAAVVDGLDITKQTEVDAMADAIEDALSNLVLIVYVAEVDGVKYETLAEALAVGGNVTLLTDIELTERLTINAGQEIVLDLNGYTISGGYTEAASSAVITNKGKLTVKDSSDAQTGKITSAALNPDLAAIPSYANNTITNSGEFILESGTIECMTDAGAAYAIDVAWHTNDASVTIKGGKVTAVRCAIRVVAWSNAKDTLNIEGGEITGGTRGIWIHLPGSNDAVKDVDVNITGGTISAENGLAVYSYSFGDSYSGVDVAISGEAEFNGDVAFGGGSSYNGSGAEKVTVTGGTFNGGIYTYNTKEHAIAVSGGTFTQAVEETYCADGFVPADNGDGTFGVVEFTPVATANGVKYETLAEAVAVGGEVVLLTDASGDGIVIDKDVTIDLGGFTYTIDGALVGSTGTKTLGFQILKDNNVTIKNGAIAADVASIEANNEKTLKMLIQNYANLTLEDVTLDMSAVEAMLYVVSNNCGETNITGATNITAPEGAVAFDVYDYTAGGYTVPTVNVDTTGTITGAIEVSETATLAVSGGTYTVALEKAWCADGFIPADNGDGTYGVKVGEYVATANGVGYETLAEAVAAGGEVVLLKDVAGAGVVINNDVTIDFAGYTYTFTEGVGSTGTESNGFQILTGNTVVLKNGTLKVAEESKDKFYTIIQNYADLTVEDMTLDGTNLDKWSTTDGDSYVLSVNSGNVFVTGNTNIIANDEGDKAFAFDSCEKAPYTTPVVTVNTTGTIAGKIESTGGDIAISGGTFTVALDEAWCTDTYAGLADMNGNYIVGVKPTATVNNLGAVTVPAGSYTIYGGGDTNVDMPLSFVMQFIADQSAAEGAASPYADWYADFVITVSGLENGSFDAAGCYLAGHYGSFGWWKIPLDGMTVEDAVRYPVMLSVAGGAQKYDYICSGVADFKCAMYLTPEVIAANPNLEVNLELCVIDNSKGPDEAKLAIAEDRVYKAAEYTYAAEEFLLTADYTAVEEAIANVPADLTIYTDTSSAAVQAAVDAVVYGLKSDEQATVDAYAAAINEAVANLVLKVAVELSEDLIDWTLRGDAVVAGGSLILTAETKGSGTSSIKARFGGLPEGATIAFADGANTSKVSLADNMLTVINPGYGKVEVPMVITSADGLKTEFMLVGDFGYAVRYISTGAKVGGWIVQEGESIDVKSGYSTIYLLFDVRDIDGGYIEVESVTRNLVGRYTITDASAGAIRFYNPVFQGGVAVVNVKNAEGTVVGSYTVNVSFGTYDTNGPTDSNGNLIEQWVFKYLEPVESIARATYVVDGDNIIVTANDGVKDSVQINFGRYFAEAMTLGEVDSTIVKKTGARSIIVNKSDEAVTFDVYLDMTMEDDNCDDMAQRHFTVTVNF